MTKNANDIDARLKFILEKLNEEYDVAKRQGFPGRKRDYYSQFVRDNDSKITESRWWSWARELNIDHTQLEAVLQILVKERFLEKYEFVPDYV